jgi:hypothetical protein
VKKNKFLTLFLFVFFQVTAQQVTLSGTVQDENQKAIAGASVLLKTNTEVLAYAFSNGAGIFKLNYTQSQDSLYLTATSLGYKLQTKRIATQAKTVNFTLKESVEQIDEIVLESEQKIQIKRDTVSFLVSGFTNKTEQTLEDVLKKIPGIEVTKSGAIKAHGKYIDKLLIEGDDILGANYKILSKNLDAKMLEQVQILDNFEDNPIIKKVLSSTKVALNIKLKKDLKQLWFGNVKLGLGISKETRWKESLMLGLLRKKLKLFYFGDFNNLGVKAKEVLSFNNNNSQDFSIDRISYSLNSTIAIKKNPQNTLLKNYITFNDALLNSLSVVAKSKPNLSFRTSVYFLKDKNTFDKNTYTQYNFSIPIILNETNTYNEKTPVASLELETKYIINNDNYVNNLLIISNEKNTISEVINSNANNIKQDLAMNRFSFKNHFNLTSSLAKNSILNNYFFIAYEKLDNDAFLQSQILTDYFNVNPNNIIHADEKNNHFYIGYKAKVINKFKKFEFSNALAASYKIASYKTKLYIASTLNNAYSDINNYKQIRLTNANSFRYEPTKNVKYTLGLKLENIFMDNKSYFFFSPKFSIHYKHKKLGNLTFSIINKERILEKETMSLSNKLVNYRTFAKKKPFDYTNAIKRLNVIVRHYKYVDNKRFSIDTKFAYSNSSNVLSSKKTIASNLDFHEYQQQDGGESYNADFTFIQYIRKLHTVLKLETTHTWNKQIVFVNQYLNEKMLFYNAKQEISFTTHFNKPYNFDFTFVKNQYNTTFQNRTNGLITKKINASLDYKISKELIFKYTSILLMDTNNNYHFADLKLDYLPEESKFSYRLVFSNIFKEKNYINKYLDSYMSYQSNSAIIPRYLLLTAKYRF